MPYTNELVTQADIDQFDLQTLWKRYYFVLTGLSWTIDRESNSYLLLGRSNPQDPGMKEFVFHWNGRLSEELLRLESTRDEDGTRHLHWSRLPVFSSFQELPDERAARLSALKEALISYRSRGVRSEQNVNFVVEFDF